MDREKFQNSIFPLHGCGTEVDSRLKIALSMFRSLLGFRRCASVSHYPFRKIFSETRTIGKGQIVRTAATATLRVHGPDQKGILANVTSALDRHGCAISQSEQWTDTSTDGDHLYFERLEFSHGLVDQQQKLSVEEEIAKICGQFEQKYTLHWRGDQERLPQIAVFVSKYDHCLWELLLRHEARELPCDIAVIISNHKNLEFLANQFGIPYYFFPITADTKDQQEMEELKLLDSLTPQVDLIVLARYMQVLSPNFLKHFDHDPSRRRIINIHHSFLPAFSGGSPYRRAAERGVKLIGATAHYVTEILDEGPIIAQDVLTVSHRDSADKMKQKGRIIERNVLVKAVKAHLDDRIIPYQNKCVVFGD